MCALVFPALCCCFSRLCAVFLFFSVSFSFLFFCAFSFVVVVLSRLCEFRAGFIDAFPFCLLRLLLLFFLASRQKLFLFPCEFSFSLLFFARKTFKLPQIEKCQQSLKCDGVGDGQGTGVWHSSSRGGGRGGSNFQFRVSPEKSK